MLPRVNVTSKRVLKQLRKWVILLDKSNNAGLKGIYNSADWYDKKAAEKESLVIKMMGLDAKRIAPTSDFRQIVIIPI